MWPRHLPRVLFVAPGQGCLGRHKATGQPAALDNSVFLTQRIPLEMRLGHLLGHLTPTTLQSQLDRNPLSLTQHDCVDAVHRLAQPLTTLLLSSVVVNRM